MIKTLKELYKNNKIDKSQFIEKMYQFHMILEDFSKSFESNEIHSIEILNGRVIFNFKTHKSKKIAKFYVPFEDRRSTPLESFNFDSYEYYDSKMLYTLSQESEIIFDIGANLGWYSIMLALLDENKKIFSFEPIKEVFNQMNENIYLNNLTNISTHCFALSDSESEVEMYYTPNQTGATSFKNLHNTSEKSRVIRTKTLDDFFLKTKLNTLEFIKCDVEGAELLVLKGGIETIKKYLPILFLEMLRKWSKKFDYHPNEILNLLAQSGYRCFKVSGDFLIELNHISDEEESTNFSFLHDQKHINLINSNLAS